MTQKDYRPISLTSVIARLCERIMLERINKHLNQNKILVKQQSGFRAHRQTKDNILSLCQNTRESFNRRKMNCVIFFDIQKAFDKIWHNGLIYKLITYKFERYIIDWIIKFLNERIFCIKINSITSKFYDIETGVPQGGVLSPILFSIFINDIISKSVNNNKTVNHSNMFADDLASSCSSRSKNLIELTLNRYLKYLETWLGKWRLKMAFIFI